MARRRTRLTRRLALVEVSGDAGVRLVAELSMTPREIKMQRPVPRSPLGWRRNDPIEIELLDCP